MRFSTWQWLYRVAALSAGLILLSGCMNVATTGAQAIYNHRSLQNSVNDQYISMQAYQDLKVKTKVFANTNITIATYNGEVLLAGQVPEAWQKTKAEVIVRAIPGVTAVYNRIEIASPSSTLTRMSDAWITTKVKSKFLVSNDLDVTQVKVVTENGMVYLMGTIKPDEAEAAVDLASDTAGVQGVVKIFSYIHISKSVA